MKKIVCLVVLFVALAAPSALAAGSAVTGWITKTSSTELSPGWHTVSFDGASNAGGVIQQITLTGLPAGLLKGFKIIPGDLKTPHSSATGVPNRNFFFGIMLADPSFAASTAPPTVTSAITVTGATCSNVAITRKISQTDALYLSGDGIIPKAIGMGTRKKIKGEIYFQTKP